ncbi:hypothetical protein F4779DRAFT_620344 [Xylariaceae sp. FL0662B]|nr:hypothetical protein F4779DRAFT_620344 [Xylariaceae sp. FL0662B]
MAATGYAEYSGIRAHKIDSIVALSLPRICTYACELIYYALVPLVLSTCTLWFAWDQYEFLTLFRKPDLEALNSQLLPSYCTSFFHRGVPRVIALLTTTVLSCGAILWYSRGTLLHDRGAFPRYVAGLFCVTGHLAWIPFIHPNVLALHEDAEEENFPELELQLHIRTWWSLTVDFAAWVYCVVATVKSLPGE